ncbi:protein angel homolog 2 isoform X2 [Thrips palmi]|uniref:Protein angel homolog 2 isoform X2 n=1 Tax=Thrips palmi TaxID=161013 RepID=A0A6P9A3R8_THRPL|nr:protein angel homolog 2 isoform X2 [Thrips palmi]
MFLIGTVCTASSKIILTEIFPILSRKYFLFTPLSCTTIDGDSTSLSTVTFGLSYVCGPSFKSTHGPFGLCPDMKHKRKRSSKRERKQKKHIEKAEKSGTRNRLKHLAMASGFQGTFVKSSQSINERDNDDNDDIIVVYDKQRDSKDDLNRKKKPDEDEVSVIELNPSDLHDIPLPPGTIANPFRMVISNHIRLQDIPLPPSTNTSDRLHVENLSEIEMDTKLIKNLMKEYRKWEHTDLGNTLLHKDGGPSIEFQDHNSFTVMSYNVLAQQLLEDHKYLYSKHDDRALTWEHRSRILLMEIEERNADILCLQEVQANHLDSFYSKLKDLGYEGIFKRRSLGHADGCAIYYKSDKFCLIESATVEYFQYYHQGLGVLDRNNVAVIVKLALKHAEGTDNHVVVATTHLLYNPRRHDIKLAQSQVLLAELDRVSFMGIDTVNDLTARSLSSFTYGQSRQEILLPYELQISNSCQHLGVLLHRIKQSNNHSLDKCADLSAVTKLYNSERYKSLHHYTKKQAKIPLLYEEDFYGRVEKGCLRHALNLQSVYQHERQSPTSKRMTREATTRQDDWVTVDYIFYSGYWNHLNKCIEEGRLKLLSRYTLPTVGQCQELKSIPNLACGSDHFSLMARFLLSTE